VEEWLETERDALRKVILWETMLHGTLCELTEDAMGQLYAGS
jgi:hypothetical protein